MEPSPHFNHGRQMMKRENESNIRIVGKLYPGEHVSGCLACCNAPACCPLFSILPCCSFPEYIYLKLESSKYIYIRENSIEWNDPEVVMQHGPICGVDPCMYNVRDRISVMYFDDIDFDQITDKTRICNEARNCLCGGLGEQISIYSPCCCNMCRRASFPCLCVPVCCPQELFPWSHQRIIHVKDAQRGLHEIRKARQLAIDRSSDNSL